MKKNLTGFINNGGMSLKCGPLRWWEQMPPRQTDVVESNGSERNHKKWNKGQQRKAGTGQEDNEHEEAEWWCGWRISIQDNAIISWGKNKITILSS